VYSIRPANRSSARLLTIYTCETIRRGVRRVSGKRHLNVQFSTIAIFDTKALPRDQPARFTGRSMQSCATKTSGQPASDSRRIVDSAVTILPVFSASRSAHLLYKSVYIVYTVYPQGSHCTTCKLMYMIYVIFITKICCLYNVKLYNMCFYSIVFNIIFFGAHDIINSVLTYNLCVF